MAKTKDYVIKKTNKKKQQQQRKIIFKKNLMYTFMRNPRWMVITGDVNDTISGDGNCLDILSFLIISLISVSWETGCRTFTYQIEFYADK